MGYVGTGLNKKEINPPKDTEIHRQFDKTVYSVYSVDEIKIGIPYRDEKRKELKDRNPLTSIKRDKKRGKNGNQQRP